jgi:hypothetical protein
MTIYRSSVHLIWRAEAETAVSYRVFLHLIGPDGQLVAQSDGEPANWQPSHHRLAARRNRCR